MPLPRGWGEGGWRTENGSWGVSVQLLFLIVGWRSPCEPIRRLEETCMLTRCVRQSVARGCELNKDYMNNEAASARKNRNTESAFEMIMNRNKRQVLLSRGGGDCRSLWVFLMSRKKVSELDGVAQFTVLLLISFHCCRINHQLKK